MDKKEILPFLIGLFVGFILLSMYFSNTTLNEYTTELIALFALFLTLSTIIDTRRHNRLSVKPIISSSNELHDSGVKVIL